MMTKNELTECIYCERIDRREKILFSEIGDFDDPTYIHYKCNEALMFYGLLLRSSSIKDGHKLGELADRLAGVQIKTRKVEN